MTRIVIEETGPEKWKVTSEYGNKDKVVLIDKAPIELALGVVNEFFDPEVLSVEWEPPYEQD